MNLREKNKPLDITKCTFYKHQFIILNEGLLKKYPNEMKRDVVNKCVVPRLNIIRDQDTGDSFPQGSADSYKHLTEMATDWHENRVSTVLTCARVTCASVHVEQPQLAGAPTGVRALTSVYFRN